MLIKLQDKILNNQTSFTIHKGDISPFVNKLT
jgi:hypothetical protein